MVPTIFGHVHVFVRFNKKSRFIWLNEKINSQKHNLAPAHERVAAISPEIAGETIASFTAIFSTGKTAGLPAKRKGMIDSRYNPRLYIIEQLE